MSVNGVMTGVQRTFLAHDGSGKAPVPKKQQKMSLGIIKGSLVRLAEPRDGVPLLLGEGVETVLTPMQATGFPGSATLGTSGLNAAGLPDGVKDVILLGENDGGKSAAGDRQGRAGAEAERHSRSRRLCRWRASRTTTTW